MYGCVLERRERPGGIAGIKWFSSPTPTAWLGSANRRRQSIGSRRRTVTQKEKLMKPNIEKVKAFVLGICGDDKESPRNAVARHWRAMHWPHGQLTSVGLSSWGVRGSIFPTVRSISGGSRLPELNTRRSGLSSRPEQPTRRLLNGSESMPRNGRRPRSRSGISVKAR